MESVVINGKSRKGHAEAQRLHFYGDTSLFFATSEGRIAICDKTVKKLSPTHQTAKEQLKTIWTPTTAKTVEVLMRGFHMLNAFARESST